MSEFQVNGVTFGCGTVDGNTWNKNDKGSRNYKWLLWFQISSIKILKAYQLFPSLALKLISIILERGLQHSPVTVCHQLQSPSGQAGPLRRGRNTGLLRTCPEFLLDFHFGSYFPALHHLIERRLGCGSVSLEPDRPGMSVWPLIHLTCPYSACLHPHHATYYSRCWKYSGE